MKTNDYSKYLEATSKSKAKQSDIDKLADEVNTNWWNKNKHRFIIEKTKQPQSSP